MGVKKNEERTAGKATIFAAEITVDYVDQEITRNMKEEPIPNKGAPACVEKHQKKAEEITKRPKSPDSPRTPRTPRGSRSPRSPRGPKREKHAKNADEVSSSSSPKKQREEEYEC